MRLALRSSDPAVRRKTTTALPKRLEIEPSLCMGMPKMELLELLAQTQNFYQIEVFH